jgi:hypothetical protein
MRWRVDWHPSPLSSVLRHVRQIITQRSVQSPSHKVRVIYLLGYISRSARNTCRRWRSGVPEGGRNCAGRKNKRCNILRRTVLVVQQIDEPVEPRGSSYSVLHGSAQNNRRPNSAEEVRYKCIIQTQNRTLRIIPLGKSNRYDFPKLWVSGDHSWSDFVGEKIPP